MSNSNPISNRYDFVYLFDCLDGNPNGDPDAGNQPRIDPQTLHGLVSDVCIKRKVRNFVEAKGQPIFIKHQGVLNELIAEAEPKKEKRDREEVKTAKKWMCEKYYDVRTFGAVMSTGSNAGQVKGSVQITFSRSIDPITIGDISMTRMAVTDTKDLSSPNQTFGRKSIVAYGLYRCHGFISANFARGQEGTGFSEEDLKLFWEALCGRFDEKSAIGQHMFSLDHSAAKGTMAPQKLIIFKHVGFDSNAQQKESQALLGCAPAHKLFELVKAEKTVENPRSINEYNITTPPNGLLSNGYKGVEVINML